MRDPKSSECVIRTSGTSPPKANHRNQLYVQLFIVCDHESV